MFNLEKAERSIIAFLILTLAAGLAILVYRKSSPPINLRVENFDIDSLSHKRKININDAGIDELIRLKGVGRSLAGRIVDHRSSKGDFTSTDDIKNVKGLGPGLFEKIKDDITIE